MIIRITASGIKPGMIIRRYAPYTWWHDWQSVTDVQPVKTWDGSRIKGYMITRADGGRRELGQNARVEVRTRV